MDFLPKEVLDAPDTLNIFFAKMKLAYTLEKIPMNDEQARYLILMTIAGNDGVEEMFSDFNNHFPFNAFFARCDEFPIKYEKKLKIWLALITHEFGIGGMPLVAYYVQWWAITDSELSIITKNEIAINDTLTLDTVIERCFPFGVFSKQTVHEFWDKQKIKAKPDNLIDYSIDAITFFKKQ